MINATEKYILNSVHTYELTKPIQINTLEVFEKFPHANFYPEIIQ